LLWNFAEAEAWGCTAAVFVAVAATGVFAVVAFAPADLVAVAVTVSPTIWRRKK